MGFHEGRFFAYSSILSTLDCFLDISMSSSSFLSKKHSYLDISIEPQANLSYLFNKIDFRSIVMVKKFVKPIFQQIQNFHERLILQEVELFCFSLHSF